MMKRLWYALAVTAVLASGLPTAAARASAGYSFKAIAFLGDPAPGGGFYTSDFEPSAVNSRGQVAFTADLARTTAGKDIGEGVFVGSPGQLSNPARVDQPAPGGGAFGQGELGRIGLNEAGDASFAFSLKPFKTVGINSGAYRFSHTSGTASAVMVPGQTAPEGGTFQGSSFNTGINDLGDMVFSGVVISAGVYLAHQDGSLVSVVKHGDPAPGGGVFDSAINGSINHAGDIAFGGHVAGEECVDIGIPFACGESVYLKGATSGAIQSIAHQGSRSPCAAKLYRTAFGPVLNGHGAIAFIGDLTPQPQVGLVTGVFLYSNGTVSRVACPGDPMPGGGKMASAGESDATYSLNDQGQVSFAAVLNTQTNHIFDTGVYVSSNRSTTLVARTGTVIPGIGQIASVGLLGSPGSAAPAPPFATPGGEISNLGQVLFSATLTDGRVVLLLATPAT